MKTFGHNLLVTIPIAIFCSLVFYGCSFYKSVLGIPQFKVGDCIADKSDIDKSDRDPWEDTYFPVYKILAVGKKTYKILYDFGHGIAIITIEIRYDNLREKIECTEALKNYKGE